MPSVPITATKIRFCHFNREAIIAHEKEQTDNKNKSGQPQDSKPQKPKFNFYWIYGLLAIIFIGLQVMNWDSGAEQVDQGDLMRMLRNQDVEKSIW